MSEKISRKEDKTEELTLAEKLIEDAKEIENMKVEEKAKKK